MVVQELVALLGVKTDKSSVAQADNSLKNLAGMAKVAAGAFMALGAVKWVKGAIDQVMAAGQETGRLAARLGISTDMMQRLGYAAKLSGSDIEGLSAGLQKMQIQQVAAANGSAGAAEKFKRLGVEIKNADGTMKDSATLMLEMADGIGGLKSDAEKTAAVIGVFGRAAGPLVGMFKKGSKGIMEMSEELSEFGAVMDGETIAATREYAKQNKRMAAAMLGIKISVAKSLIPILAKSRKAFMDWYAANGKIIRQHIEKFFTRLGTVLSKVTSLLGRILSTALKFISNLNPMTKKIAGVTAALLGFMKILSMGTLGKFILLITILLLLLEDFQVWLEGGNSAFGKLLDKFKALTGLDIGATLREAIQAFNILAADPEPFDWAMYFEEVGKVVDEYLAAAGETWREVWSGIWAWYENLFVNNPLANYLGAALNLILGFWQGVYDVFSAIATFLTNVWNAPTEAFAAFTKTLSDNVIILWENVKAVFDKLFGMFETGWTIVKKIGGVVGGLADEAGGVVLKGAKAVLNEGPAVVRGLVSGGGMTGTPSGGTTYNAPTNVTLQIQAGPGMNEKRLATEASRQMGSEIDRRNRKAMQALIPQKEGI